MMLLGVDPSLSATGLAAIDLDAKRVVAWTCIRTKPIDDYLKTHDMVRRLSGISFAVRSFCAEHRGIIAIEGQVGSGMGKASMSNVAKLMAAYGAVIGALPTMPIVVMPAVVKRRLSGRADASKHECFEHAMASLRDSTADFDTPDYPSGGKAAREAVEDAVCIAVSAMPEVEQVKALSGAVA